MGLIDLQTDLKSLKFGKDRPGGGSSGQPYIKSNIPDKEQPSFLDTDFVWRGGLKAPIRAAEDVARLSKYIFDPKSPRGVLFVAKQNLLSRTAVSTESLTGPAYANGGLNGGVYTPLSTLAQAGVGFTGTHLNKQGIDPTSPMTGIVNGGLFDKLGLNRYEKVVWGNNSKEKNRFYKNNEDENLNLASSLLTSLPNVSKTGTGQAAGFASSTSLKSNPNIGLFQNRLLKLLNNKSKNYPEGIIDEYDGGPGSVLGIGKTRIKFATDGNGNALISPSFTQSNYQSSSLNYTGSSAPSIFTPPLPAVGSDKFNYLSSQLGSINNTEEKDKLERYKLLTNRNFKVYSPLIDTFSKLIQDSKQLKDYQATGKSADKITEKEDSTYKDAKKSIDSILNINRRELISPTEYDRNKGQWYSTSKLNPNVPLGTYSSQKTLYNDYTYPNPWDSLINGGGTESKDHKIGYLANLDKNAEQYILDGNQYVLTNNNYPGGISPDFRLTNRNIRNLPINKSLNLNSSQNQATSSQYYNDNGELKDNTIQRIYYSSNQSSFMNSQPLNQEDGLIPFNIEIVPSSTYLPSGSSNILKFRAYVDGFSDSYTAGWNSQKYIGRAESFYKYESFDRDISFSFTVVADNKDNLDEMYKMLNRLAASLSPEYSTKGYMTGNLHRITLGNYINGQYGIVKGFTYEISENTPWDIETGVKKPLYIKVSGFKFTPIHNFRPEYKTFPNQYINQA